MIGVADQDDETDRWISGKDERDVAEVPIARGTCIGVHLPSVLAEPWRALLSAP